MFSFEDNFYKYIVFLVFTIFCKVYWDSNVTRSSKNIFVVNDLERSMLLKNI